MGEAEAFAALFAQHHRLIRAYSARRVGSADAEEVTAEVFLLAWQRWDVSQPGGLPWLYRTAANVVANHLRTRRRHDRALLHLQAAARTGTGETATGDAAAEARVEQAAAAAALLRLSEGDRELLLALSWDGLSIAQLAAVSGCSVPTAYVRVHRARRRLAAATRPVVEDPAAGLNGAPPSAAPTAPLAVEESR